MLPQPNVIAIDNEEAHLRGLVDGLMAIGVPCKPVLFQANKTDEYATENFVRYVFSDLYLMGYGEKDAKNHYSAIMTLLSEIISPGNGPYVLFLWTRREDQATDLEEFLHERGKDICCLPIAVIPIPKSDYMDNDGNVFDQEGLADRIRLAFSENPQVAALLSWETRAVRAAGAAVATVDNLISAEVKASPDYPASLGILLSQFADAAVGSDNIDQNRLTAINEALYPLFLDELANQPATNAETAAWNNAFDLPAPAAEALREALLNRIVHISTNVDGVSFEDRGVVIDLNWDSDKLRSVFGYDKRELLSYFRIHDEKLDATDAKLILIQIQASCDYAQRGQKYLPYLLGIEANPKDLIKNKGPDSQWRSPKFELDGEERTILACANFLTRFASNKFDDETILYRFREQILGELTYQVSGHIARPGIYSFGKR